MLGYRISQRLDSKETIGVCRKTKSCLLMKHLVSIMLIMSSARKNLEERSILFSRHIVLLSGEMSKKRPFWQGVLGLVASCCGFLDGEINDDGVVIGADGGAALELVDGDIGGNEGVVNGDAEAAEGYRPGGDEAEA